MLHTSECNPEDGGPNVINSDYVQLVVRILLTKKGLLHKTSDSKCC